MRCVITGGAGFIGSQLGLALSKQGYEVLLVDNMSYGYLDNLVDNGKTFGTFLCKDIRNSEEMENIIKEDDIVIHLAGISSLAKCQSDPGLAYDVNVGGTARVLEAARKAKAKRVIFASTSAVYENTKTSPHKETDLVQPNLVYAMTKHAAEQLCKGYADCYGMDILIVRFFNVYGAHQDILRTAPPFTSYLAREFVKGKSPVLFNQTSARRDYIYISDLLNLLIKMIDSKEPFRAEIFNATSAKAYTVQEIYSTLQEVSGKTSILATYDNPSKFWNAFPSLFDGLSLHTGRIEKEVHKNAEGDSAKTCATFDWEPLVSLQEGLRNVWEYAKSQ